MRTITTLAIRMGIWLAVGNHLIPFLHAANPSIKFDRLSVDQGLSQSTVTSIVHDRRGFMWFGTEDGLSVYDGYEFEVYRYDASDPHSIPDNMVSSLYEDGDGMIWIGMGNGALCRVDPVTRIIDRYGNLPNEARAIVQDNAGKLWIGTFGAGVYRFDPVTKTFTHHAHDPDNGSSLSSSFVQALYRDRSDNVWAGTVNGLNRLVSQETKSWVRYFHDPVDPNSLSDSDVRSILQLSDGRLWIGTLGGINELKQEESERFVRYTERDYPGFRGDDVQALWEDDSGIVWIGTFHGLKRFDKKREEFVTYQHDLGDPGSISGDNITCLFQDRSGLLWIGTRGGGVSVLDRKGKKFLHYTHNPNDPNSLSHPGVRGIYEDQDGILWVGGYGGLNRIDRETGQVIHYGANTTNGHGLNTDLVYAIIGDTRNDTILWIGSEGDGLYRFHKKSGKVRHYLRYDMGARRSNVEYVLSSNFVFDLYMDSGETLWLATGGGLNRLNTTTNEITYYRHDPDDPKSLSGNDTRVIYEDRSRSLWIGTDANGLSRLSWNDGEGEEFIRFQHIPEDPESVSSNRIKSIYQDRTGTLWIGTGGAGLNRFDRVTETFKHYTEEDGLPSDVVYGILEDDDGNLWLSTNRGLSRFDPQTGEFRNYDLYDGLQSNEFNTASYFKSRSGEMFFGGINGLNAFHPEKIREYEYIPPVVITDFQIFNESVPVGEMADGRSILQSHISETDEIDLSYEDDVISFEFAALSYAAPGNNKYAYKMEGFDKDWVYTDAGRRFATYTHLPPGNYLFRVKGSNQDGVWNEAGTSLKITVTPPPWKTWWAYAIYVILFLTTGPSLYFWRVNQLKKRDRRQRETIARLREIDGLRAEAMESQEKYQRAREKFARQLIESQEQERKRISAEMHDALGQDLLILKNLALMALEPGSKPSHVEGYLTKISQGASDAIEEVRKIARLLRPYQLDRLGLAKALESILVTASDSSQIRFSYDIDRLDGFFHPDQEIHIYRILQECVSNIIKHSDASEALVMARKNGDSLTLTIKDDGKGFDREQLHSERSHELGFGLSGIAERVRILGGKFEITSSPGEGTVLSIVVPIPRTKDEG
ncbi:MAG: two-component regulator propeller domain-containing protein [Fidelibacterota bacterium]